MSENPKSTEQNPPTGTKEEKKSTEKEREFKVTVDDTAIKQMAEQNAKLETEKKAIEEKATKAEADRKTAEEAKKASDEATKKVTEENEDLKGKLGLIAEKELEKKRTAIRENAKRLFQNDAERIKDIEAKLTDPEGVQNMEFTLNVLDQTLKKGEEAAKKLAEENAKKVEEQKKAEEAAAKAAAEGNTPPPAGTAPLNEKQLGAQAPITDMFKMQFDSHEAMVRYLREAEKSPNPETAAKAKAALGTLFEKWTALVKSQHDAQQREDFYKPTACSVCGKPLLSNGMCEDKHQEGGQKSLKELTLSERARQARKQLGQ